MLRPLVPSDHPILRALAANVDDVATLDPTLLDDMIETMIDAKGVGLAAPQIGVGLRIFVIDRALYAGQQVFINPVVLATRGTCRAVEGCLSLPGVKKSQRRYEQVIVHAVNAKGQGFQVHADGWLARCIQHEMDHLRGVLIDRR